MGGKTWTWQARAWQDLLDNIHKLSVYDLDTVMRSIDILADDLARMCVLIFLIRIRTWLPGYLVACLLGYLLAWDLLAWVLGCLGAW